MSSQTFDGLDHEAVRSLLLQQAEAETAHSLAGMDAILARPEPGEPDPVNFVTRAYRLWGREAVLSHFQHVFTGTWRFEPDEAEVRITPLGPDAAHIYAPTKITIGAAGTVGTAYTFLVNEFAVRTSEGWRIATIIPVPAA